jgi:outer membrane protein assembly factor BamA
LGGGGEGSGGNAGGGGNFHNFDGGLSVAHAEEEVVEEVVEVEQEQDAEQEDQEEQAGKKEYKLQDKFKVKKVIVLNEPKVEGLPSVEKMVSGFQAKKASLADKKTLKGDIDRIMQTGLFENVNVRVVPVGPNEAEVTYDLKERKLSPVYSVSVSGTTILPEDVVNDVRAKFSAVPSLTPALLGWARNRIDGWYRERGLAFGCVSHFEGVESGAISIQCFEGVIDTVKVFYETRGGKIMKKGNYPEKWIWNSLPFKKGHHYNLEDGKRALRNVYATDLYENVQVIPRLRPPEEDPTQRQVVVEVRVMEKPIKTTDLQLEWGLAPGESGRPTIGSVVPAGEIFVEHKNVDGDGASASGSLTSSDLLMPTNDIGFKVEYKKPYIFGMADENKAALVASAFNTRKQSVVFSPGSSQDEVPVVWITRTGARVGIHETYSRNSKGNFGFVLQQVKSHDESGALCTVGSRKLPNGTFANDGPPTTLSDTGSDTVGFLQCSLIRDTTHFQGGSPVGARDVLQVDQGLGIGSCLPFFNRHLLSGTRFIPLPFGPFKTENLSKGQPQLILSAKYANCIGDLPTYEAFALGGPHSVRAYGVGELGICRTLFEYAAEVRVPVKSRYVYGFYEHGTDLGSSKLVRGNPTECYRKPGGGTTYGAGLKLGIVKLEYAMDCNNNKGHMFFRFGERF